MAGGVRKDARHAARAGATVMWGHVAGNCGMVKAQYPVARALAEHTHAALSVTLYSLDARRLCKKNLHSEILHLTLTKGCPLTPSGVVHLHWGIPPKVLSQHPCGILGPNFRICGVVHSRCMYPAHPGTTPIRVVHWLCNLVRCGNQPMNWTTFPNGAGMWTAHPRMKTSRCNAPRYPKKSRNQVGGRVGADYRRADGEAAEHLLDLLRCLVL